MAEGLRIAVIVSFSGEGGVERMIANLVETIPAFGVGVDLLRIRAAGPFAERRYPSEVRVLDLPRNHALSNVLPMAEYLRRAPIQAVLAAKDRSARAVLAARFLARRRVRVGVRLGTNLSASLQGASLPKRWLRCLPSRLLYPAADALITVSRGVAEDTAGITGLPQEGIQVISNPVITPALYAQAGERVEHSWFEDPAVPVLVAAGRLTEQKGFATLIRAVAEVRARRRVRLLVLGEGRLRDRLQSLIQGLGLGSAVQLAGFEKNPYKYMRRASLFVLSSNWEGSPNVLTEAMALGTPVVAADCPSGPREILQDGRVAPLVPVGDHLALARAIEGQLDNPTPAPELQRAVEPYQAARSAARYLRVLLPEGIDSSLREDHDAACGRDAASLPRRRIDAS